MPASGRAHYRWSSGGGSAAGIRHSQLSGSQVLRALEVLKQLCLTRVDLASGQGSRNWLSWPVVYSRELMDLDSTYASQAGRKVVGREARNLAAANSGGGSKLWRRQ